MRVTFDALIKLATLKGLEVERTGDEIEVWHKDDHAVTAVCGSVLEAYQTVISYEHGKGMPL